MGRMLEALATVEPRPATTPVTSVAAVEAPSVTVEQPAETTPQS